MTSTTPDLQFPNDVVPCTSSITFADPLLAPLQTNGVFITTMKPLPNSPAVGVGTNCPATDALGKVRPTPCTLGVVEP